MRTILTVLSNSVHTAEIIGVIGTIAGTIVGWFLRLLSDNMGKLYIFAELCDKKLTHNEYGYSINLFIMNTFHSQQCIRDATICFATNKRNILFESRPSKGPCTFESIKTKNYKNNKMDTLFVGPNLQVEYCITGYVDESKRQELEKVKMVILKYKDNKNKTRKKIIEEDFCIGKVSR